MPEIEETSEMRVPFQIGAEVERITAFYGGDVQMSAGQVCVVTGYNPAYKDGAFVYLDGDTSFSWLSCNFRLKE